MPIVIHVMFPRQQLEVGQYTRPFLMVWQELWRSYTMPTTTQCWRLMYLQNALRFMMV
jgi:hypothetical protein